MRHPRMAAIDIGTNSIRCIIVEVDEQGKYRVLDDEKATVRLGEGIARDNMISPAARQRAVAELARMKKIVDGYGVVGIEAVATSAVRRADNGEAFVAAVSENVGLAVEVISGEEEAELAASSALHNFHMDGTRFAMLDIGGGSVEIVTAFGNHVDEVHSLDIGAVVLTEKFVAGDPVAPENYLKMRKHIRRMLRAALEPEEMAAQCLIGSGGTATSIAAMVMASRKEAYSSVHGYEVLRSEVVHLLAMLLRKDLKERKSVPGLNPDRADIIMAGVAVVDDLMELLNVNVLRINERGLREGLILKGLKKHGLFPAGQRQRNWRDSVTEFARSCHYDESHSRQVAIMALAVFDALAPEFDLGERDRQILEAAALLHDVGYFISYAAHHKHSYHLIRHADLFDFTPRERELTAQVARYHRKALPKKKHDTFQRLSSNDQVLVNRLGGILRLADGLDRRRNCHITSITCSVTSSTVLIKARGDGDVSVELFGGKNKGDLFEVAFDRKLILVADEESINSSSGVLQY